VLFVNRILFVSVLAALVASFGCKSSSGDRTYQLTGQITALDAKNHVATVDAAAIPNYMEAMAMDYPVKSASEFNTLHTGEHIKATITVHTNGNYELSNIQPTDK
jgi:hypothetical protein